MVVMKFGGSSVMNAQNIQNVASLVYEAYHSDNTITPVVVLSAMKGVTDALLEAAHHATLHDTLSPHDTQIVPTYLALFQQIRQRHCDTWNTLIQGLPKSNMASSIPEQLEQLCGELEELLHGIALIKECTPRTSDIVQSFGERMSCCIFTHYCNIRYSDMNTQFLDSRKYVITDNRHGYAGVKFDVTYKKLHDTIDELCNTHTMVPVITGFIAGTEEEITTTLGRNGSDYTAALVGASVHAERIEIWTDVDGILSADPSIAPNAFVISRLSYNEAMELSYFGAKVIHPQTVVPAIERGIPIVIKNTRNPSAAGTTIEQDAHRHPYPITGLTSVQEVGMLTIEGAGLSGNFHFLPDVFTLLSQHHVQPLLITQSSSEHSISFVLHVRELISMQEVLKRVFVEELKERRIQSITAIENIAIVSVIGSQMRGTKGLAGKIFNTMGRHNINVIAIAQGSNEINVSLVVESNDEHKAIKGLHDEFFNTENMV